MSHTPGPWYSVYYPEKDEHIIYARRDHIRVGTAENWAGGLGEANVALINAAPDLLEACQDAMKFYVLFDGKTPAMNHTRMLLAQAIAKATGKPT